MWPDCPIVACFSLCLRAVRPVCVCVCVCVYVCMHACQVFIVDECVMFFTALCPRLTVHLLRLGGRWYCHSAREGGGVDGQESWGGRYRRKRSGLLLIVALSAGVKFSHSGSLQEGKQTRSSEIQNREGERRKDRAVFKPQFLPGTFCNGSSQPKWVGLKETDDSDFCFLPLKPFIMDNESCECVNLPLWSESERSHKTDWEEVYT